MLCGGPPLHLRQPHWQLVQANMSTKVSGTWCLLFFEPSCECGKAFMQQRQANLENVPVEEDHVDNVLLLGGPKTQRSVRTFEAAAESDK